MMLDNDFKMILKNDDDDEIFIVQDEDDEDQDSLFIQPPSIGVGKTSEPKEGNKGGEPSPTGLAGFEKVDIFQKDLDAKDEDQESSPDAQIENPFKDNLANSELQPVTQKLEVFINENYLAENSGVKNADRNNANAKP